MMIDPSSMQKAMWQGVADPSLLRNYSQMGKRRRCQPYEVECQDC